MVTWPCSHITYYHLSRAESFASEEPTYKNMPVMTYQQVTQAKGYTHDPHWNFYSQQRLYQSRQTSLWPFELIFMPSKTFLI